MNVLFCFSVCLSLTHTHTLLFLDDLLCCVYLCLNQLGPAYLGMELGVGETVLMKAVAQATGNKHMSEGLCFHRLSSAHQPESRPLLTVSLSLLGRHLDKIKAEAQEKGDLGLVAESSRSNQRTMFQPASLTAGGVFKKLKEIASMSGNSVSHRITFSLDKNKQGQYIVCLFELAPRKEKGKDVNAVVQ